MPIELPPKVKCPDCLGSGVVIEILSTGAYKAICPRCHGDGEIYLFEDLAAAVAEAGLGCTLEFIPKWKSRPHSHAWDNPYVVRIYGVNEGIDYVILDGPDSISALLAAIRSYNERESK